MMLRSLIAATVLMVSPVAAKDVKAGGWVDLTHAFNENSIYWPTAEPFTKTTVTHGHTPGGWFYSAYNFAAAEHGGTHIDAPIHFADGGRTVDQVPVDRLVGPAFVIDVSSQSRADVDYLVSVADIEQFEARNGRIPEGAIVLLNTGRAKLYGDPRSYMGTTERGPDAVAKLHFPGLSSEGAALLVTRRIAAVGIDTPSIDRGQSKDFAAHVELMTHNIPAFENVGDMSMLPPTGSMVIALPMKIEGGSGGPLRIIAQLPDER